MKFPTIKEMAEEVAEKALDGIEYEGKTLREWVKIILATDTNVATKVSTNLAQVGTKIEPQYKTDYGFMWLCPKCGLPVHSDYTKCVRCGHNREKGV